MYSTFRFFLLNLPPSLSVARPTLPILLHSSSTYSAMFRSFSSTFRSFFLARLALRRSDPPFLPLILPLGPSLRCCLSFSQSKAKGYKLCFLSTLFLLSSSLSLFTSLHFTPSSTTRNSLNNTLNLKRLIRADDMRYSTTSLFFSSLSLFSLATTSIASPIFKRGVNEGGVTGYEGGMNGLSGLGDSELPLSPSSDCSRADSFR